MSFAKAYFISLIVYIALNLAFTLIFYMLMGSLDIFINAFSNISFIGFALFGSIIFTPTLNIFMLTIFVAMGTAMPAEGGNYVLAITILFVGYLITQIVSSFIAGRLSESRGSAFGAWMLTAFTCGMLLLLFTISGEYASVGLLASSAIFFGGTLNFLILIILLACLINGIFYGCIALLALKSMNL